MKQNQNHLLLPSQPLLRTGRQKQRQQPVLRLEQLIVTACFLFSFFLTPGSFSAKAQSTGFINRQATVAAGRVILDPNSDGYTSKSTTGYAGDDVANSEISYRPMPAFSSEPYGDLRRGPDHRFSDFVPDKNNRGYYTYFNGTQMLFRFRMGSVMPGSKGYSVLIDTDGKFGNTGPDADPNYRAETTGTNGNPGFEIEIVLETNFRIAIYNVDGAHNPTLVKAYTAWQDMSQVSVAGTFDNGDPDFFIDFYIPFSDLQATPFNLTTSTPLRMCATTVMSPQAAIGGPKSDIHGINDSQYKSTNAQYEDYIRSMPSFTPAGLTTTGIGAACTAPPTVNSPISSGTVTVSGTWSHSTITNGPATANIIVYRNGVLVDTVKNVNSGSTWSLSGVTVADGQVISARAQAAGESLCLTSNTVTVQSCNTANTPPSSSVTITCTSGRGMEGAITTGRQVTVYFINPTTLVTSFLAGPADNSPTFGYSGSNWFYNGTAYNGNSIASACSGGTQDMNNGVYFVTARNTGATCESGPVFGCVGLSGTTATPVLTQTALYPTSTTVSGTATTNAQVYLYINGQLKGTATATGGIYNFNSLVLAVGDDVKVYALVANSCMSSAASLVVTCFTAAPLLTVDNNGQLPAGQPVKGISGEPANTTIRLYNSANTLLATTNVQSGGTWTTTVNAVAGTSYYATAQAGTCGLSSASASATGATATVGRCGNITGPVAATDAALSGTLTGAVTGTTVNLYMDGLKVGSVTTGTTTWSLATSSLSQPLYSNAIITMGIQESGRGEQVCPAAMMTVNCDGSPASPQVSPSNSNIFPGLTQTYTVSNAVPGAFYGLADSASGKALGDGVWATSGTVSLTTYSFSSGNYKLVVKATSLSGLNSCTSPGTLANLSVTVPNNTVDIDDDNDGIPDLDEYGGIDPFADADGDGTANYLDTTPGGSLPSFVDANSDGINDFYDTDKDGVLNSLDLDSDNDGIPDLVEAGGVDTNGDGVIDGTVDANGNGLMDLYDPASGGVAIANLDTDGDGIKNAYDLDSDGDGIPDVVEAGGTDANNDGTIDSYTDTDNDGFADSRDGDVGNNGVAENSANALIITGTDTNADGRPDNYPRANTDGTGLPNPYDLDADGDGILDTREAGLPDSDNNGIADGVLGTDGWSDTVDALPELNLPNTDGRGPANYLDIDSDDDGLTDNVEAQTTSGYQLPSGNDSDGDGIDDVYDNNDAAFGGSANNGLTPINHDGTDSPDYTDGDSDNDGVSDLQEGTGNISATLSVTADTDSDGLLDQFDTFNTLSLSSNLQNNVTITGMGNGGIAAGPATAGSNVTAHQTEGGAVNRDWRNLNMVLPLQLLRFGAERQSSVALVQWTTANETNMKAYKLERSTDGVRFVTVATIPAKGAVQNSYSYRDDLTPVKETKCYYRLQQLEENGRVMYSSIVSISLQPTTAITLVLSPNPATGPVTLQVTTAQKGTGYVSITDYSGKIVEQRTVVINTGSNQFLFGSANRLPSGSYLLHLEVNGERKTAGFIVQQ